MRLVGDIGGTKALLGLIDETAAAPHFVAKQRLLCAGYPDFAKLLADFFSAAKLPLRDISGGCFALAGPIAEDGGSAKLTNLPWVVDAAALSRQFSIGPLKLVNDFAAAALGVTVIAPADLVSLQAGIPVKNGIRLVVGAGTGLGMATLVPKADSWRVLAGEGGHIGFAPTDDDQLALWTHLRRTHAHVGYEQVVSGPGLVEIYRFLTENTSDQTLLVADDPAAAIAQRAAEEAAQMIEGVALRAIELFLAAYGAYAGDMALALNARGGVFLAGGVATHILPLMQSGLFIRAFNAKGGHGWLTQRMPVHVVTDPELGLKGAAQFDHFGQA